MAERFDRHRAGIAVGVLLAVLLLGAAAAFVPWLTRQREVINSTPVRTELLAPRPIVLRAGERACLHGVPFEPRGHVAQVTIAKAARGVTRLSLATSGGGWRAAGSVSIPAGQAPTLAIPFAPPRRSVIGALCLRNAGRGTVALAGTVHPWAIVHPTMTLDGQPVPEAFTLTLREPRPRSFLARVPQLADRAAALSPVGPWLFWVLIALLLVGVPACVIAALGLALREP